MVKVKGTYLLPRRDGWYAQEQEDYYIPYTIIRYITMEESMSEFLFSVSKHIGKKIKVDVHIYRRYI